MHDVEDWKLPWQAACLCGRVKMRVTAPPIISMACHCRGCQKLTSGPYSLTLMLPEAGFVVVEGETVLGGMHRAEVRHHYCAHCKSWLYTAADVLAGRVNFRSTMLEDPSWVLPFVEAMTAEKLPAVVTGATRSYPGFPPLGDYEMLIEAYAREGARPSFRPGAGS
ncbi:MAG: GFA family protein [Deltaproteobacteria bacterium]|nr:MAG: GFA family protein [Deltaproteobacteria bacterium]